MGCPPIKAIDQLKKSYLRSSWLSLFLLSSHYASTNVGHVNINYLQTLMCLIKDYTGENFRVRQDPTSSPPVVLAHIGKGNLLRKEAGPELDYRAGIALDPFIN